MTVLSVGCGKKPIHVDVVSYAPASSADHVSVDVKTEPHAVVSCNDQKQEVAADESGNAKVDVDLVGLAEKHDENLLCIARLAGRVGSGSLPIKGVPILLRVLPDSTSPGSGSPDAGRLQCGVEGLYDHDHECAARFTWTNVLEVEFDTLGAGAKVTVGDATQTSDGTFLFKATSSAFDVQGALADTKLRDLSSTDASHPPAPLLDVPIAIAFPDGAVAKTTVHGGAEVYRRALLERLKPLAKGPVLFPGEKPDDPNAPTGSLLVLGERTNVRTFGAAVRVRDVDRVALILDDIREKPCGKYVPTTGGGQKMDWSVRFHDVRVTVYERRSGKKLDTKTFPAPPKNCPEGFTDDYKSMVAASESFGDGDAAFTWAAGHAMAGSKLGRSL